jgi:hypothetical protein
MLLERANILGLFVGTINELCWMIETLLQGHEAQVERDQSVETVTVEEAKEKNVRK